MRTAPDPSQQIFRSTLGWKLFYALLSLGSSIIFLFPIVVLFIIPLLTNRSIIMPISPAIGLTAFIFLIGAICNLLIFSAFRKVYHVISPAGIEYHTLDLHIYTPWHNIIRVEPRPLGIYNPPSLILKEPAVPGNLEEGKRQGIATIRVPWYAAKDKTRRESIPLLFTVPRTDWRACELGAAIRHYAPQALDPILDGTPVQQTLHRAIQRKLHILNVSLVPAFLLFLAGATFIQNKGGTIVNIAFATFLVLLWLAFFSAIIYLSLKIRFPERPIWYKDPRIFMLPFCLLTQCGLFLNLAYLCSWVHDPLSAFLASQLGNYLLFSLAITMLQPFASRFLATRFIAREAKQLEALQTTQQ